MTHVTALEALTGRVLTRVGSAHHLLDQGHIRSRHVDFVENRHQSQVLLKGEEEIGDSLRLDPLTGIDHEQSSLRSHSTGRKALPTTSKALARLQCRRTFHARKRHTAGFPGSVPSVLGIACFRGSERGRGFKVTKGEEKDVHRRWDDEVDVETRQKEE